MARSEATTWYNLLVGHLSPNTKDSPYEACAQKSKLMLTPIKVRTLRL